jgi:hypothetical protein
MFQRRRFAQTEILEQRLSKEAHSFREQAKLFRPGTTRAAMLRMAEQAETAAHVSEWLRSPGLRPPTR